MDVRDREHDILLSFPLHNERDLRHDYALADASEEIVKLVASFGEMGEECIGQFEGTDPEICLHRALDHDNEKKDADGEA